MWRVFETGLGSGRGGNTGGKSRCGSIDIYVITGAAAYGIYRNLQADHTEALGVAK